MTKKIFGLYHYTFVLLCCFSLTLPWPCEDKLITVNSYNHDQLTLTTLYGSFTITEPVLLDLLESTPMQRLKEIRQLGIWNYAIKPDNFNRYDHSVGVFTLVRKTGGSLKEQIAALLHDVSHTVFSHVGAFFFVNDAQQMDQFQDNAHEWYLQVSGLADILKKHGYTIEEVVPKNSEFQRLEQELPNLCADRIDYNIRGALWDDLITAEEAQSIIDALRFKDGTWYFSNLASAKKFAEQSLIMTKNIWASAENFVTGILLANALHHATTNGIITENDVWFSTDTAVWNKLKNSLHAEIINRIIEIEHCHKFFIIDEQNYTHIFSRKFRGLDPLIKTEKGLQYLSVLDNQFAQKYQDTKNEIAQPLYVKIWHLS
jgi:uncharacterized protein